MSEINLMICVTREQQVSIEEHCINSGLSISAYLMALHEQFQRFSKEGDQGSGKWVSKQEDSEEEDISRPILIAESKMEDMPRKKKHSK